MEETFFLGSAVLGVRAGPGVVGLEIDSTIRESMKAVWATFVCWEKEEFGLCEPGRCLSERLDMVELLRNLPLWRPVCLSFAAGSSEKLEL